MRNLRSVRRSGEPTAADRVLIDRLRADLAEQTSDRHMAPSVIVLASDHLPTVPHPPTSHGAQAEPEASFTIEETAARPRRRWRVAAVAGSAAAAGIAALSIAIYAPGRSHPPSGQPGTPAANCAVINGPLPTWARAGFTPSTVSVAHVTGTEGNIVAVLFANPPTVPPAPGRTNKILWVSRVPAGGPLIIDAQLGSTAVTRSLPDGPGPSTVDLPAPGCWTLHLSWAGHHDTVHIAYARS